MTVLSISKFDSPLPYYATNSTFSTFAALDMPWIEGLLDWLSHLTDAEVCFDGRDEDDPDWEFDCQDAYDVLLLLALTGNLDAPL